MRARVLRESQSGKVLGLAGPWVDGRWAVLRALAIEERQIRPSTFLLKDREAVEKMAVRGNMDDPTANPFATPRAPDGKPNRELLHIGMVRIGGLGDDLVTGAHCIALKRRFANAFITLFARDNTGHLADHPGVDRLVFGGNYQWREIARDARERFDAFVDLCYVPKVWVYRPDKALEAWGRECRERFYAEPVGDLAGPAWWYYNFPESNRRLIDLGKPLLRLTNDLLGLQGDPGDVKIALGPRDRGYAAVLKQALGDYVVVHNGSACGRQTKNWPTANWVEIVKALAQRDVACAQVGHPWEEPVEGCLDLRGVTTICEMAGVIEGARLLLDTEGGPAHVAHAVGTPAVVLFGPTPALLFGYPSQWQIEARVPCAGCWYEDGAWHIKCPRGYSAPFCMASIAVEEVLGAACEALGLGACPPAANTVGDACLVPAEEQGPQRAVFPAPSPPRPLLAVAIPTRNRPESLRRLLESIAEQTMHPDELLIVVDSDPGIRCLPRGSKGLLDKVAGYWNLVPGERRGAHFSHQLALETLTDCDFILRLDDDLVLESPDFIERLYSLLNNHRLDAKVGAVGGVYPEPGDPLGLAYRRQVRDSDHSVTIEGMMSRARSAQFFRYGDDRAVEEAEHLYSSFMYRRAAALQVGGYCLEYSARGQREETDLTHRLYLAGYHLLIDTGAVARHERCPGGRDEVGTAEEIAEMTRHDEELFILRLRSGQLAREAAGMVANDAH